MKTGWIVEILAVLDKELRTELRARAGLMTAMLFSVSTVVAIAFATFGHRLSGSVGAGLLWVSLLFASLVALPRTFLAEEEQGTANLLRLMARPHAVFWGKAVFNLLQMLLTSAFLAVLFVLLAQVEVARPWLLVGGLAASSAALAGVVTLSGALVAQAVNRGALVGAVALPLLVPLVALGVAALRVALGEGLYSGGINALIGLVGYAVASFAIGPYLFAAIWKS
jgi:heme exporter protein B